MEFIDSLHKTLKRQIRKYLGLQATLPADLQGLFKAISDVYTHSDGDRALTQRSVMISSNELMKINKEAQDRIEQIERMNRIMVDRELRMIELKNEIKSLKDEIGELRKAMQQK